jgi:hypothetical protein
MLLPLFQLIGNLSQLKKVREKMRSNMTKLVIPHPYLTQSFHFQEPFINPTRLSLIAIP